MVTIIRKFVTAIPATWWCVNNEYVHGRISAILQIFCHPEKPIRMYKTSGGDMRFEVCTNESRYAIAQVYVEDWYPGMCEFDVTRGFSED